jgi:hypothetical protein
MKDYSTLHLDINSSKWTELLLFFCVIVGCSTHTLKFVCMIQNWFCSCEYNFINIYIYIIETWDIAL